MKCSKCNREATHDVPRSLCDCHWEQWFTFGWEVFMSPKRLYRLRYEALKNKWRKKRPKDWKSQLRELR